MLVKHALYWRSQQHTPQKMTKKICPWMAGTHQEAFDPHDGQRTQLAIKINNTKPTSSARLRDRRAADPLTLFAHDERKHEAVDFPNGCRRDKTDCAQLEKSAKAQGVSYDRGILKRKMANLPCIYESGQFAQ